MYAGKIEFMDSENIASIIHKKSLLLLTQITQEELIKQEKSCINCLEKIKNNSILLDYVNKYSS
jgi:hypothetical protein